MSKIIIIALTFILMSCQVEKKSGGDDYIADHRQATNTFTLNTSHSGTFKSGDVLNFTLSFPSNVIVTGSPLLALEIDDTTRYAEYVSGDGSKVLNFQYTIQPTDNDSNGIRFLSINLNGGSLEFYLKDELTNCSTSMKAVHFKKIIIDNTPPSISRITHSHLGGDFYWNDLLTFTVQFDEKVFVSGTPSLRIQFNTGGWKEASYVSGSGTQNLSFRYAIENNVADTNGLGFNATPILLAGGSIKDSNGNNANLTSPGAANITATTNLKIDGRVPKLVEFILPKNDIYQVSEHLDFILVFDRNVTITGLAPYLALTVGETIHEAELIGVDGTDTLTFRYTPLPGHVDLDGIAINNTIINANSIFSGTIPMTTLTTNNNLKNPDTSEIFISAIQPMIERISRGTDITMSVNNGTRDDVWIIGQQLHLIAEFNTKINVDIGNGSPTLNFSIGGVPKVATYLTGGAGADTMTFVYTIQEGDESTGDQINVSDILLNYAVVIDDAGTIPDFTIHNKTLTNTTIDGIRPTISSIIPPADGHYSDEHTTAANQLLRVETGFSEPVNLSSNQISIPIIIGTNTRNATLESGNNTQTPIFRYNIVNLDNDTDGVSIQSTLNTNGTTYIVRDLAGNEMVTKTFTAPATPNVIVDTTHPGVALSSQPSSQVYLRGDTLTLELTFNETVKINTSGDYPLIPINNISPARYFKPNFTNGRESTVFEFTYQVQPQDIATNAITLGAIQNSGTSSIRDLATNTLPVTTLVLTSTIRIDAEDVTISSQTSSPAGYYRLGDSLEINLEFSEEVYIQGGVPSITASVSGVDYEFNLSSGDGTDSLTFTHVITDSAVRLNGLGSVSAVSLNGSSIKDENGIDASLTFTSLNLSALKIIPDKYLALASGSTTDVFSEAADIFSGSLNLDGSNSFATTKTSEVIVTRITFNSSNGSILGGIPFSEASQIVLTNLGNIQSVRVNGVSIPVLDNEYLLGVSAGTEFILEVELTNPVSGTLFDNDFVGQIHSIILLDSPLTSTTERNVINDLLN